MSNQDYTNKTKPPYWIGVFCLIPLIGAVVGLIMLILGLSKYRDKWFARIGMAGIGFTIIIYFLLFYAMNKSQFFKQGFADISQMQLNSLVKDIEFYKLQHGQYPDSLQQIVEDNKFAPVNDVIQVNQGKDFYYNYKRIGDKYTLFSSGVDGIPRTKDDFFPKIIIKDSSRIGLIKL